MILADLKDHIGWVTFTFPDGTKRTMRTTTNKEILKSVLHKRGERQMYDLDKQRWITLPPSSSITKLEVSMDPPEIGELMWFVNRFI